MSMGVSELTCHWIPSTHSHLRTQTHSQTLLNSPEAVLISHSVYGNLFRRASVQNEHNQLIIHNKICYYDNYNLQILTLIHR